MEILAEDVESQAQNNFLAEAGYHVIQGFLYSKPMSSEALLAQIKFDRLKLADAVLNSTMHPTIFSTPLVNTMLRAGSILFLKLAGWKTVGALQPEANKSVFIAAPHTSNWDLPFALMCGFVLRLNMYWMGKASLFGFPFGGLMRWIGGIAIDRAKSNNVVAASALALTQASGALQLVVAPEGTRSKTRQWKTGFYHIAVSAKVPIVMAYIDYEDKIVGLGPLFYPTGDIDADMLIIKAFYAPFEAKKASR